MRAASCTASALSETPRFGPRWMPWPFVCTLQGVAGGCPHPNQRNMRNPRNPRIFYCGRLHPTVIRLSIVFYGFSFRRRRCASRRSLKHVSHA